MLAFVSGFGFILSSHFQGIVALFQGTVGVWMDFALITCKS